MSRAMLSHKLPGSGGGQTDDADHGGDTLPAAQEVAEGD